MSRTVTEINRLNKAVNEFQEEMKTVLAEKAAHGKTGWDILSSDSIYRLMMAKAEELTAVHYHTQQQKDEHRDIELERSKIAIDMANLSMFYKTALEEGR